MRDREHLVKCREVRPAVEAVLTGLMTALR